MTDEESIRRMLDDLFQSFQTLDPCSMVPYYHLPSLAISGERVSVMSTPAEVEARFARVMERLKTQDYARSSYSDARVMPLGDRLALLRVSGARYRRDGKLIEPLNITYVLRKTDAGWKVVVLASHDPGAGVAPSALVE